jgi:uncharacterized membrane protein YuzA (DUF378 family)
MKKLGTVGWIAWVLVIIGSINWGLVGIDSNYNLVTLLFGSGSLITRGIYILVGLAALVVIYYKIQHLKQKS